MQTIKIPEEKPKAHKIALTIAVSVFSIIVGFLAYQRYTANLIQNQNKNLGASAPAAQKPGVPLQ